MPGSVPKKKYVKDETEALTFEISSQSDSLPVKYL